MLKHYPLLDETLFSRQLSNGLTVKVVPKTGFSRKIAYFVTRYGAIHRDFRWEDQDYHMPTGVAHFLEHKLFDLPDRDVSGEFAALGANVNAFTSYDLTAYYFSCSEHFEDCLKLLLEFVSTPYFTKESVEKEYGIIDQEIGMFEDSPDSRDFELLMTQMYRDHPVKTPILGSRESLRQITPEVLDICHQAFYTPANMILCVVGDVDPEKVSRIALEVLGSQTRPAGAALPMPREEMICPVAEGALQMEVAMDSFRLGFKCECPESGADTAMEEVIGYLAAEALFGESSPLYLKLYEKGLIDTSFGGGFETLEGCAMMTCGGDSRDCGAVRQAILEEAARLYREGIPQRDFLRLKRGAMGRRIRDLDSFDSTCYRLCAYSFTNFDYFRFPELYESVTEDQVRQFIGRVVTAERCTMTVIHPL